MRDSILVLALFGILTGGFLAWQNSTKHAQQNPAPVSASVETFGPTPIASASHPTVSKTSTQRGKKHEARNLRRREQVRHSRPSSRPAATVAKSESLPSLYQAEERGAEQPAAVLTEDGDTEFKQAGKPQVIPGVPVAAWVKENRNRLKNVQMPEQTPEGLRVFVGCMEMKKESKFSERQCEELIAKSKGDRVQNY